MYTLKRFYSAWQANSLLCIGIPDSPTYLEVAFSNENMEVLNQLTSEGVRNIETALAATLRAKGMLEQKDTSLITSRKDLFFEYMDIEANATVYEKSILVLGAGAIGATITYLLAQFGFRNIALLDGDVVEESDLEKTMIYRKHDIGQTKTSALYKLLRESFDTSLQVYDQFINNPDELKEIITVTKPALVVKAADFDLPLRLHLNDICFEKNIPFIHLAYAYEYLKVGPLFVPGLTCCDHSNNSRTKYLYGDDHDFKGHKRVSITSLVHPSVSFNINTLASMALKEIIMFLNHRLDFVKCLNAQIIVNLLDMHAVSIQLECSNTCCYKTDNQ